MTKLRKSEAVLAEPVNTPTHAPLTSSLGQREREIMAILCEQESASVQQVSDRLNDNLAYTTVMTTLDRLFKKGFLQRKKQDRAYIYSATLTSHEIEDHRAAGLIRRFFSDSGEAPSILLSCLVNAVHQYDSQLLDQLESKVRAARMQQSVAKRNPKENS